MKREWKPGDVAVIEGWADGKSKVVIVRVRRESADQSLEFAYVEGGFDLVDELAAGFTARPLVVIDPEDREQVERLADVFCAIPSSGWVAQMQAALRSLVAPPRPKEPTGLGAVVEATCGCSDEVRRYVRDPDARDFNMPFKRPGDETGADIPWVARCGHHAYSKLSDIRVLSEGVQP